MDEIFIIIGNICIFLAGIFPLLSVFSLLAEMDDKGRMLNVAFLVSGSCLLGDHLAYATQVDPAICEPMLVGKLIGGLSAVLLALLLAPRLLERKP